jgi:hypothetical protein
MTKLQEKKKLIEYIIRRNKAESAEEGNILRFPLIATVVEGQHFKLSQPSMDNLFIFTPESPPLYGDVDLLVQINKDSL